MYFVTLFFNTLLGDFLCLNYKLYNKKEEHLILQ